MMPKGEPDRLMPRRPDAADLLRFEPTEGDFPHARRGGVPVACCTCTTCCFTVLVGGLGAVVGIVRGVVAFVSSPRERQSGAAGFILSAFILLCTVAWYAFLYLLAGALIGFAVDFGWMSLK